MKEKNKKYLKYLVDILILGGIWIFFYAIYFPISGSVIPSPPKLRYDYSNYFKFAGIILITIGIDIAVR